MFSAVSLRLFVCQQDNFRTTKHGMMKCKGLVHCIINSAEFEFGGDSPLPVCAPQMWRLATTLEKSAQATVGIDHSVVTTFVSLKPVFHVFFILQCLSFEKKHFTYAEFLSLIMLNTNFQIWSLHPNLPVI